MAARGTAGALRGGHPSHPRPRPADVHRYLPQRIDIIRLYGLRFKIEHSFKQAVRVVGTFTYHFWMSKMKPLRRRHGNQYRHRESAAYRDAVKRKSNAYHLFIHAGVVAHGVLQ